MTAAVRFTLHPDATVPHTLIMALSGELDYDNADVLCERITALLTGEYQRLVLDLSGLTFCDSTGIKVFLALRTLIDERSGAIALTDLHPRLDKVFQMTGLGQLFAVYPARADALNLMRAQPSAP